MESKQKVAKEVALKEVENWLDFNYIPQSEREEKRKDVEAIADAISTGLVVIDPETFDLKQILNCPVKSDIETTELIYKSRLQTEEQQKQLRGVLTSDGMGMIFAYAAAATGKPKAFFGKLITADTKLMQKIVVFFA